MADAMIRLLHVGTVQRDKSIFTYLRNMGIQVDVPLLAWHIVTEGRHILVDTGGHDPAVGELHPPYRRERGQDVVAQLAAIGVRPEEIQILILTHLHWDHAANVHLFPKARVLVQREELRYAAAPLAPHRWAYESHPPLVLGGTRFEVLEGDAEIAPGVSVHLTPGHTPGLQGVAVRAGSTRYFIASDNVPLAEMWDARERYGAPHWPNAIHVDLERYFRTLRHIEELADVVLPSHDLTALQQLEYR
jgi:glyoxylase-like metal-dependent hydrolase (beta-lactamase superfamily II)